MYAAYFDRKTEHEKAVLLVEAVKKDFHVPLASLPAESEPGSWLRVTIQDNEITSIQVDHNKTAQMKENVQNQLARLQATKKSRFKRR